MKHWLWTVTFCSLVVAVAIVAIVIRVNRLQANQPVVLKMVAPEVQDADDWINTKPLKMADLRGQVVIVHFWTFD